MTTKQKYYLENRDKLLNYQKDRYKNNHKRKYKKYYLVITPDGKELKFERNKDLANFLGLKYVDHFERVEKYHNYKIKKVY